MRRSRFSASIASSIEVAGPLERGVESASFGP
jgi:hypothetical protein